MRSLLLTILLIGYGASMSAQSPLDKRIDFTLVNEPLESALFQLIEESGVAISFSNNLIPEDAFVTLSVRNEPLRDVLDRMLRFTNIRYEVVGNQIVLVKGPPGPPPRHTIRGYLVDADSGEPLIGANIYTPKLGKGTSTNAYGFYSITLDEGFYELNFSYLGYRSQSKRIALDGNRSMNIELVPSLTLPDVIVTANLDTGQNAITPPISTNDFNTEEMDAMPSLGGEADLLRTSYSLPGVQTGADGFGGMAVRGGNVDQNLYLIDGVPVYNATHLLGIYSVFNSSSIRSAKLIKGGFPARYGGRVSSVLDVRTKEGNLNYFSAEGDLGLTSGKFSLEGPIVRGKSSYFVSARRSFIDVYSRPISSFIRERNNIFGTLAYFFYDVNAKVHSSLGKRDKVYLSFYNGGDDYFDQIQVNQELGDTTLTQTTRQQDYWGNVIGSLRWNHLFGDKLFMNTTATFSSYYFQSRILISNEQFIDPVGITNQGLILYEYQSNNRDWAGKIDFDYVPNPDHYLRFGVNVTGHRFQPGAVLFDELVTIDSMLQDSVDFLLNKSPLYSTEYDAYVEDEWQINELLRIQMGLRGSVLDVQNTQRFYLQPRFTLQLAATKNLDLQLSVGKSVQALHLLSNSGIGRPRDLWVSSTDRIEPIESWQMVAGAHWRTTPKTSLRLEGYYKKMDNLITFLEGSLAQIDGTNWQNKVAVGQGWSYGMECHLKKHKGATTGWLSYTLAFTDRQFPDVNLGERFPFRFDRRHNISLQLAHTFNDRWSASGSFTFHSGNPTTLPRSYYEYNQLNLIYANFPPQFPFVIQVSDNGKRNDERLPAIHRLDLSGHYSWPSSWGDHRVTFGFYNAYNQHNPIYYFIAVRPNDLGELESSFRSLSLVPVLPALRYRLRFKGKRGRQNS